ncbi:30S ribosomal protein S7 [Patescibacteria group bacterium]|jgi:small subunit ribosomal protein S7|nr:30S ribosomal protein S7 [Patescibacteria group bacterium]
MRRPIKKKLSISGDVRYDSLKVEKLINYMMWDGKKETARRMVYAALEEMKTLGETEDPVALLEEALKNAGPTVEVRSRRVGGANYQVPREVRPERRLTLALRWIRDAARAGKGRPTHLRLAEELVAASKGEGVAVKKREDVHKMAEANRAFAHFAW